MIPENFIEQWQDNAPWQSLAMVEQDLIISRALIDLYNNSLIKGSLVFRGGTALNKLFFPRPQRYSEDIDLVQLKPEPIGKTINSIRDSLLDWLGDPIRKQTKMGIKLIYKYNSVDNTPAKLKIEINTVEHFHVYELQSLNHSFESEWHVGSGDIVTYHIDELLATKLRALYQRRKGRDLFDLWYALKMKLIDVERVIEYFKQYCNQSKQPISRPMFLKNLQEKKENRDFQVDMLPLLPAGIDWNFEESFNTIVEKIIARI